MTDVKIDLDAEAIWLDHRWQKKDELVTQIRQKLEAGDYAITAMSQALEQLTQSMTQARVLAFRLPAAQADLLAQSAHQSGISVGQLLRQAVEGYLGKLPTHGTAVTVVNVPVSAAVITAGHATVTPNILPLTTRAFEPEIDSAARTPEVEPLVLKPKKGSGSGPDGKPPALPNRPQTSKEQPKDVESSWFENNK